MRGGLSEEMLLKPEIMIELYANGAFPMADESGKIDWYMPEVRTVIPLDSYNYPRSLRKFMEKADFEYRYDHDYLSVIRSCADRDVTWITPRLIEAYSGLYARGHLHTVEVYEDNNLIGGLYGISFRGAFFGESMFSRVSQASKCALIRLIERLKQKGFSVLDVQYQTEHLEMFGAREIAFAEFQEMLAEAYKADCQF